MSKFVFKSGMPDSGVVSRQLARLSGGDVAEDQISMVLATPLEGGNVILCHDDDLVVGIIQFTRETEPDHFYVHHFSVLSSHRRRGIGRQLIERLQRVARKAQLPILVRDVTEDAVNAMTKCGFVQVDGPEADPTLMWSDLRNSEQP